LKGEAFAIPLGYELIQVAIAEFKDKGERSIRLSQDFEQFDDVFVRIQFL
jgi:hypothetical protein